MTGGPAAFQGFPGIAKATAVPNLFFSTLLPAMKAPGELLAFLWTLHAVQEQKGEARFVSAAQLWEIEAARQTFEAFGGGEAGLIEGLRAGANSGALLALQLQGPGGEEPVYFVNNPSSRRAVARARAGEIVLRPGTVAKAPEAVARPGIFRMYEEHIGTITPFAGERLLAAMENYDERWIEQAFREAAELNVRNWRYVERTLERWALEGRPNEPTGRTPREAQASRTGGGAGYIVHDR